MLTLFHGFTVKGATPTKTPGSISRSNSGEGSISAPRPSSSHTRSVSQAPSSFSASPRATRPSSSAGVRPPSVSAVRRDPVAPSGAQAKGDENVKPPSPPAPKTRPRPSSVCGNPTIPPRTNKSAALRAAKMEAEAAAAAAAAAKKAGKRPPPSAFKASVMS